MTGLRRLGLIVNPIAGIGGRVGLKGSDGEAIQQAARALGAQPQANQRAAQALAVMQLLIGQIELVCAGGQMGEHIARESGFTPIVVVESAPPETNAAHTIQAAQEMVKLGVDLLLFAGGDGTARDIYNIVGSRLPVLGIPAGVKIYSAVFATHPRQAGEIAVSFLQSNRPRLREVEVIDLDEDAYRAGLVQTRLYGYLNAPDASRRMQNKKAPTPAAEAGRAAGIAAQVVDTMDESHLYIVGPGTTTRSITEMLGFPKTLVGVDVIRRSGVVALDANESQLLALLEEQPARIVVTPIGGQGFLFGRGNQPISARVIENIGRENIIVVSLIEKMNALGGRPLLVDTGEEAVDEMLAGYLPVIVGYHEKVIYPVSASAEI